MKIENASLTLIALLFFACSKEDTVSLQAAGVAAVESTVSIPLNDLGTRTYKDSSGGLYPGGMNEPLGQYAADLLVAATSIIPIDSFGNPSVKGKVVFISMGGSTGGHNMISLKLKTTNNPLTNPNLWLINCNTGSGEASLSSIMNAKASYWSHVKQVIAGNRSSYRQVQLLYLETDDTILNVKFPTRPNMIKDELEACLRMLKQQFPNIKIVYVLGRTRTFGPNAKWNTEPSPYYFGWACKWAIRDQINSVPGTEYKGIKAVAPMLTWGFYQWADSLARTTDNFYWRSTETEDGLHANQAGQDTLSDRFQKFLLTDKYAKVWYARN